MPAYQFNAIRLVLRGTIAANQSWSCGLTVHYLAATLALTDLQTWLTSLSTPINQWWSNSYTGTSVAIRNGATADTTLSGADAYLYTTNSPLAALVATLNYGTPIAGTSTTAAPTQTCAVASLRTDFAGRSNRGRIYVPATGATLSAAHKFSDDYCTAVAGSTATLIGAINDTTIGGSGVEVVVGTTQQTLAAVIKRVVCDNEPDIQRRRADQIAPSVTKTIVVP